MTGICFTREEERWAQDQWSWVFSNFGVTEIWERPSEVGTAHGTDWDIYQTTINVDTADELPGDRPLIVLASPAGRYIQGTEPLEDFVHPDDAIYLFGGSHENLDEDDFGGRQPDALIYIPYVEYESYGHAAAYITLWDRYVKRGEHG